MDDLSKIKRSIRRIAGGGSRWCFTAKVKSVDGEVCSVETEGLTLTDVRLRAVVNNNKEKILITPKKDSCVLVYDMTMGLMRDFVVVSYSCFASFSLVITLIVYLNKVEKSLYQIFNEEKKRCYKETISYLCALIFLFSTLWKV